MITIDQLLESVDLDFEPRFVTKDESGIITIWADKPSICLASNAWIEQTEFVVIHLLKLANFENKDWTECIYEVPLKPTRKIELLKETTDRVMLWKINELVDAVNELKRV
jgi:hypothetical protein